MGVAADMTVLFSTGPDDPLLILGLSGKDIGNVRMSYELLLKEEM